MTDQAPVSPQDTEQSSPADKPAQPLLLLKAESLRKISDLEVIAGLPELVQHDIAVVSLDFTDLVVGGVFRNPEEAVKRLTSPQSKLLLALSKRGKRELVFCGLAHIPVVALIGHLVTDRQKVHVLDFHPSPGSQAWAWPGTGGDFPQLITQGFPQKVKAVNGDAVIRVSVTYQVSAEQTNAIVPNPVLSINLAVSEPVRDIITSEAQVRAYGHAFRQTLDKIARDFPGVKRVHLFYAGPVSLAFHLGQQISENIHPPVVVWNYHRGYDWGIDLAQALHSGDGVLY